MFRRVTVWLPHQTLWIRLRSLVCFKDVLRILVSQCLLIHVSEKNWKNSWSFAVKCRVLWTRTMRSPYHNNDKRDLWVKRRPSSRAWQEVWGCKERNLLKRYSSREGKDPPRSTQSQFFQESVSMRQLWGEAFISLMHCITACLLEKAPSLCGWMKKIRIGSPLLWAD